MKKNYIQTLFYWCLSAFLVFSTNLYAQDGKAIFDANCTACHKMGMKLLGPDLTNVGQRASADFIKKFIENSTEVIATGDAYAVKLLKDNNNIPMTAFKGILSDSEIDAIVTYLVGLSAAADDGKSDASATTSSTANADLKGDISNGKTVFEANCAACHKLGMKLVGPDLIGVGDRASVDFVKQFILNSTKLVESGDAYAVKVFKENNSIPMTSFEGTLSDSEVDDIVAYLISAKAPKKEEKPAVTTTSVDNNTATTPIEKYAPLSANDSIMLQIIGSFAGFLIILFLIILIILVDYIIRNSDDPQKEGAFIRTFLVFYEDKYQEGQIMEGHSYDGIVELDNGMPPWLKYLFYLSVIAAISYYSWFQLISPENTQIAEYKADMAAAVLKYPKKDINVELMTSPTAIAAGKAVYKANCAACHGQNGEGIVGPNLTDEYWLHGGTIKDVFRTVKVGVPNNGMISWEKQLGDKKMLQVASYIMTLQGTNPPNAKAPEGTK